MAGTNNPGTIGSGTSGSEPSAARTNRSPTTPHRREARTIVVRSSSIELWVAIALACTPIATALLRIHRAGWIPEGDVSLIWIRSRDVFGGQLPLLGFTSSASDFTQGVEAFHPGPSIFYAAAPFNLLAGGRSWGLLLFCFAVNAASVGGIVVLTRRLVSHRAALWMAVGCFFLLRSLGAPAVRDPLNTAIGVLPFALLLVCCWAVASGDLRCLPLTAFVASFIAQLHYSYDLLVAAVSVWAVVGLVISRRADRRTATSDEAAMGGRDHDLRRWLAITAGLSVVCWLPPLIEQVTASPGNFTLMTKALRAPNLLLTPEAAARRVSFMISPRPLWLTVDESPLPTATPVELAAGIALLAGVLVAAVLGARRGERSLSRLATTAVVATVAGGISMTRFPAAYVLRFEYFMWLYPLSMMATLALGTGVWRMVRAHQRTGAHARAFAQAMTAPAATLAPLAVLGALVLTTRPDDRPALDRNRPAIDAIVGLGDQLEAALPPGGVYALEVEGFSSFVSVAPGLFVHLEQHGHTAVLNAGYTRGVGSAHTTTDRPLDGRIIVRSGPNALVPIEGGRLVARLDAPEAAVDARRSISGALSAETPLVYGGDGRRILDQFHDTLGFWGVNEIPIWEQAPLLATHPQELTLIADHGWLRTPEIDPELARATLSLAPYEYDPARDTAALTVWLVPSPATNGAG